MMKAWVNYLRRTGPEEYLWLGGFHYGDWLAMDAGEDSYVGATSNDLIASAFFAWSTEMIVRAGKVLGEDVSEYEELYANVRKAFREYFMENGMPKEEFPLTEIPQPGKNKVIDTVRKGVTQTGITLILHFGLCEEEERPALAAKLVELIRENENRMTTGFVGTPYLLHVLSAHGYTDVAYELLMQERNPSWLYSVTHGATTMWEHWNSLKEDGSFWSTSMNSFNHYAYGAVFDWIFGVSSGITPVAADPAYKTVNIAPHPSKCLGWADASIESRNGFIRSYWYYKGETVYYEFDIPAGVTANVTLPSGKAYTLSGGSYRFAE
jgi:alpha-L-rhamnosidase